MQIRQKVLILVSVVIITLIAAWGARELAPRKITVAVDAPLMSKRIFDPSDMDAARFYFEETPNSRMQLTELFYDFDPKGSAPGFKAAIDTGVEFFVTTQPSSTLTASANLFAQDGPLLINTSATSPTMTAKDDFMLRIIADAKQEQEAIADYINTLPGQRVLVLQDDANAAYTDPAFKYFVKRLREQSRWQVTLERFTFEQFKPENFSALMAKPFDVMYLLGGDFQASMGNIMQLFHQYHPNATIVLTPWARSTAIYETAGPAINNVVLLGHHKAKVDDPAIADYLDRFKQRYGYEPMAMALMVRQALEILEQAFAAGHTETADVRRYLLSQDVLNTSLGDITLDQFGDMQQSLHPIGELEQELKAR